MTLSRNEQILHRNLRCDTAYFQHWFVEPMHFDLGHFKGYISKLKQLLVVQHIITIPCYSYVHEMFIERFLQLYKYMHGHYKNYWL